MILFAAIAALSLILMRWASEFWLGRLNERHVCAHATAVPEALRVVIDEPTYFKSVEYTLAKSRFGTMADFFDALLLLTVLFSGVLPWAFEFAKAEFGESVWSMAGFLFAVGIALSLPGLPFDWYA